MVFDLNKVLENIQSVLRIYLSRGKMAYEALESNLVDEAIELLKKRRAAYYNYLALDYRVRPSVPDYESSGPFAELWESIRAVNQDLEEIMDKQRTMLIQQRLALTKGREKLNKFKSLDSKSGSFQSEA